jgi:predicted pyridoxine 5'-phosphate oxidase superfamily flavin-nucleotide-binding protein
MAERFEQLEDKHIDFIQAQKMYFVGTAADDGYANVSPKGMDSFRVLDNATVAWLNLTGSGNETAAHVLENGRMTVMFCSFDTQPLILRLYGQATVTHKGEVQWDILSALFPRYTGARQIFSLALALVQTSCGYAVPHYTLKSERPTLTKWADGRGEEGIRDYWQEKNRVSLNGKDTGIS